MVFTTERFHSSHGLGQQDAATEVRRAISLSPEISFNPSLAAVRETDIYRLRRGLCLPSATATCVNATLNERVVDEEESSSSLSLGRLFVLPFKYHNNVGLVNKSGEKYKNPWFVVDANGNMYHQALIATAQGFGLEAMSIGGFDNLYSIMDFVKKGGKVGLSLNNRFVLDETLGNNPEFVRNQDGEISILIEGEDGPGFRRFQNGRHAVSLLGVTGEGKFIIHDSFSLPQQNSPHGIMGEVGAEVLEKYLVDELGGKSRAIAFAPDSSLFSPIKAYENRTFIPKDLVQDVRTIVGNIGRKN